MTTVAAMGSTIRVVIYGEHAPWADALYPNAPLWSRMDAVHEVLLVPDAPDASISQASHSHMRTVVIPLRESHTRNCPRQFPMLIPDNRSIDTLGNKAAFAEYVRAHELAHLCPKTYHSIDDATFPCVLKRVDLDGGDGIAVVQSFGELTLLLSQEPWHGRSFVLQSLAAGATDHVTHCVCRNGHILWHCSFAYDLDGPAVVRKGSEHTRRARAATASPQVLSQIARFLAPLSYSGPCNVDYKLSETGDIVVFEINPRFGGSLMTTMHADHLHGAMSKIIAVAA